VKVVFDTNVLISAFATEGLCAGLLIRANKHEFELFISPSIIREFKAALVGKIGFSSDNARQASALLEEVAEAVDPQKKAVLISGVCRDDSDHAILEAAVAACADYVVTGDRELLDLKEFRKIRILSPRQFEMLFTD